MVQEILKKVPWVLFYWTFLHILRLYPNPVCLGHLTYLYYLHIEPNIHSFFLVIFPLLVDTFLAPNVQIFKFFIRGIKVNVKIC